MNAGDTLKKSGDDAYATGFLPGYIRLSMPIFTALASALLVWSQIANSIRLEAIMNMWPEQFPNFEGVVQEMSIFSYNHHVTKTSGWFFVILMGVLSGAMPYVKVV